MPAGHALLGKVYLSEIENGRKEVCIRTLGRIVKAPYVQHPGFLKNYRLAKAVKPWGAPTSAPRELLEPTQDGWRHRSI